MDSVKVFEQTTVKLWKAGHPVSVHITEFAKEMFSYNAYIIQYTGITALLRQEGKIWKVFCKKKVDIDFLQEIIIEIKNSRLIGSHLRMAHLDSAIILEDGQPFRLKII